MSDPKLCESCKDKDPDFTVRGTCQAPSFTRQQNLPKGHRTWTDSPNFVLCESCADHFQFCQWCSGPIDGYTPVTVPTDKRFVVTVQGENGRHIKGMDVGEQILCKMTIDRYSGKVWDVKDTSYGVRLVTARMVTDGSYWSQYATLELYFDLNKKDPNAFIELEEVSDYYWYAVSNPQTWKVTAEVR